MTELLQQTVFLDISVADCLLMTLVMTLGASLQASAGFGSALLGVPLLGLINKQMVPGPILFASLFLCSFMLINERTHISGKTQLALIPGLLSGTGIGFAVLFFINAQHFPIIAALLVFVGVALSVFHKKITLSKHVLFAAGSTSGLMSILAGLSGPPMALVLQFQQPAFIRANLACAFVFASLFSISGLAVKGLFQLEYLALGLILVPGMFIGVFLGGGVSRLIDQGTSRLLILTLASISAFSLLFKSL